ncbi:ClpXP protease specificity-enhancing factor [Litorivicinus lipolyticus]|jgi:stringent starvation protein B|uniref:ClpXP protease specificity-enhancing factor n=1 Tax=Litorivicinus lipolyticus TaxID=418701 RepID=UPI003B599047
MNSSRPYLLRGLYEWMLDNDATPHIMVDETQYGVQVPAGFGQDGMVVLSLSPSAVRDLSITNTDLSFSARFAGKPENVWVPMAAVKGIFSKETGEGMQFVTEPGDPPAGVEPEGADADPDDEPPTPSRPGLRIVR